MRKICGLSVIIIVIILLFINPANVLAASTPSAPTLAYTPSTPTNGNITVTVYYPNNAVIKQYKLGTNGVWITYTSPFAITVNTYICAQYQDNSGNWSTQGGVTISNIDKTPPTNPTFIASTTMLTNQNVSITIGFSQDSTIRQYRLGSTGTWTNYSVPITLSSNNTIYAKAQDLAGNWSVESSLNISNIDKAAPVDPIIIPSITDLTNQNVSIGIIYSLDSVTKQYKLGDSGLWTDYSSSFNVNSNGSIYARACDNAGNWTLEVSYLVSNIDITAPDSPTYSASSLTSTTQPVTVTINYSMDSTTKQYKLGINGNWTDYTSPVVLNINNTIYSKASDAVGNWCNESSYTVANIVKIVLGYTVKYYSTDVASYNSIVANTTTINEIGTATYSVDASGSLTGTAPTDQINYANNNGIRPNLMISNNFDSNIAQQMLESTVNRQKLRDSILNLLNTYNYKGVDIDIENIPAVDRNNFTSLMSEIYSALKPLGYEVSTAVPAKTCDTPNAGWNYAYDYKSLAVYSDYLMIMAYDEHYPGGTPGAIASIGFVTNVVDYALTVVSKDKIVLGLAAYGYDWSSAGTTSYSINNCINLANQYGATIYLDNATKSKYFTYTVNGVTHTVWFEDADTIAYKLDVVNSRDLKGIGIWRLGLENPNYWSTIKSRFNR